MNLFYEEYSFLAALLWKPVFHWYNIEYMKTIIISNGYPPSKNLLLQTISHDSIIIAADGGANCLYEYQIMPHYLIGDFDSVKKEVLNFYEKKNTVIEKYPTNKDQTDSQLALAKALSLKTNNIVFLGCIGGNRIDHFFGSLGLLLKCFKINIKAHLIDDYQTVSLVASSTTIYGNNGDIFSLQAYGETVRNLNIIGSKYELCNYDLEIGDSLTLSNEFQHTSVSIEFTSGVLIIITWRNTWM